MCTLYPMYINKTLRLPLSLATWNAPQTYCLICVPKLAAVLPPLQIIRALQSAAEVLKSLEGQPLQNSLRERSRVAGRRYPVESAEGGTTSTLSWLAH